MEEALGEHIFGVVGNATHISLQGLEEHGLIYHHERNAVIPLSALLEEVGGGVVGEDVFHLGPSEKIDFAQFEL